ncbi:hypothetical protein [Rufibacter psychrotolerans]|uniref:hypothetical protein n=1 Tax=Rufibacter psychrotolerans TaxID=2812556 RepID=UPI001967716B|nr:hypothetical protein [Rufibacter sp. SYSU D00308]
MKELSVLAVLVLTAFSSFARPTAADQPLTPKATPDAALRVSLEEPGQAAGVETGLEVPQATPDALASPDQEKPKKARGKQKTGGAEQENDGDVKKVATARRQGKPEKVEAGAEVNARAKAPRSAARPGRGAARAVRSGASSATKSVGNAVKATKPVKVGGKVGVGPVIKPGKN